jgi:hypothetical protein
VISALLNLWHRLVERQPIPPPGVIVVTAAIALGAVLPRPVWRLTRGFITIAHEGGHALVAVLAGRRLSGIRLHSDTSGLTLSKGRPTGPGMILTGLAGYVTPPLLGLGGATLLGLGHITMLLWLCLLLLPLMLIMIRNVYGVLSLAVTMAILVAVAGYTPAAVQAAFGYGLVWFLLIGGVRPVFELQRSRRRHRMPDSDADQVGRLTHVPALLWVGFFAAVAIACLLVGGRWLLMLAVTH